MQQPLGAAEAGAAHAVGALPDLLAHVFDRLPPVEQCMTASRLARASGVRAARRVSPRMRRRRPGVSASASAAATDAPAPR